MAEANHTPGTNRFSTGLALVIFSGFMLLASACWFTRWAGRIDFPCGYMGDVAGGSPVPADSRIAYCISKYPRMVSGASPDKHGATSRDKITLWPSPIAFWHGKLSLEREGETLFVNGQPLQPGGRYSRFRFFQSINPWVLVTARITVWNNGTLERYDLPGVLGVGGDIDEGAWPSPLGLVLLVIGIRFLIVGRRDRQEAAGHPL